MQRRVWDRSARGLTMRGYGPVVRECEPAFGIEKSAVSERFVLASAQKVDALLKRKLHDLRFCAVLWDGVQYKEEHLVTALGIDSTGHKMILGFSPGGQREPAGLRGTIGGLGWSRAGFKTTTSEYHRWGQGAPGCSAKVLRRCWAGTTLSTAQASQCLRARRLRAPATLGCRV